MPFRKLIVALFLLYPLLLPTVSAYSFQGHDSIDDSVRLVLNEDESDGDIIAIDVEAYNVPNVSGAGFYLYFDPSVLTWAGIFTHDPDGYEKGNFFGDSALYLIAPLYDIINDIMNDSALTAGVSGDFGNPVDGSGTIMTIKFRITGTGTTDISLFNSYLAMSDMQHTTSSWFGGTFSTDEIPPAPLEEDDPPVVTLVTPDSALFATGDADITCSASDDYGLSEISLYTDIGGIWAVYESIELDQNTVIQTFYLKGLQEGVYRWDCQAMDTASHSAFGTNDHFFFVQFPVDHTPPQISNNNVTGNFTTLDNLFMIVETNEDAVCKFSMVRNTPFESMQFMFSETGAAYHSTPILEIHNNSAYFFYVRCEDMQGNSNRDDLVITFSTGNYSDTQPPTIISASPTGPVDSEFGLTIIHVNTDENSECRYSTTQGTDFDLMKLFSVTQLKNHTETINTVRGTEYTYYVKCRDMNDNTNLDTEMNFFTCYEVDLDCSREIIVEELFSYIDRWYMSSRDVTMGRMIQAVVLWKSGGG